MQVTSATDMKLVGTVIISILGSGAPGFVRCSHELPDARWYFIPLQRHNLEDSRSNVGGCVHRNWLRAVHGLGRAADYLKAAAGTP